MKNTRYREDEAHGLLPLLDSIAREIRERREALVELENRIDLLAQGPTDSRAMHALIAQAATHRRGIRLAKKELERLGCAVVGNDPITFRIPGRVGEANHSFVWQTGDPILK